MNQDGDLCWFHGKISREFAEQQLNEEGKGDGTFLVRESNSSNGDYVLSVINTNEIWHYQIRRHGEDAFFSIDDQTPIHGLDSLIQQYREASHGLITQLIHMVKGEPPPHDSRSHGRTNLLHRATKEGNFTIVSELLKCGYRNIDAKNQDGQTAVHLACCYSNEAILQKLIDSGANINSRDKDGNTPLHYACRSQPAEVIKLLVEARANMQARNNGTGRVPLHEAAEKGNLAAVKQLLEMGAPYMPRTTFGELPVDFAREAGQTKVIEFLENYSPPMPTVHQYQWYHGTLDRNESNQLIIQYTNNMPEQEQSEVLTDDSLEEGDKTSGTFLVRFSKHSGDNVLTLFYNKNPKHFIIQKFNKNLYIDEGPYMPTLEHLIEHYMRFSDGLPINLRYPVPPKPKPPLPLFSTIPKNSRNRAHMLSVSPHNTTSLNDVALSTGTGTASHIERKISADGSYIPQRNLSIPSDELMNHVGILSTSPSRDQQVAMATSPPGSKKKSTTEILNFRSLKLPKKNIIKDGMKSLKKCKSPKDAGKSAASPASTTTSGAQFDTEISQSMRNLTFSSNFKASEGMYNIPTNNGIVSEDADIQNHNAIGGDGEPDPTLSKSLPKSTVDYFTKCDKTFLSDLADLQSTNKEVEEIYFVDAPTKMAPMTAYVPFKQVPYFPTEPPVNNSDHVNNNNTTSSASSMLQALQTQTSRLSSTASINSNESEIIMALQNQLNESGSGSGYRNKQDGSQPAKPNYYIPKGAIALNEVLGEGEFGSVYKGTMLYETTAENSTATEVPVAIKTLHDEHCKENRTEFLREADVMLKLSHHCIVKLLGISKGPPLMIIQELVSLGSLLNYLILNTNKINCNFELKIWASQIACGMNYLESHHFVHRDLAARNILLSSRHQAKISDFGLSRALGAGNNYYQASQGGKWPIKWYAPESYNYGTFSHASDVWSFGVTLWEMFSFGQPPYGEMKGVDVIQMVDAGQRLQKPEACPDNVFHIMESCWNYSPKDRPTFRQLTDFFSNDPDYQNVVELIKTENIC